MTNTRANAKKSTTTDTSGAGASVAADAGAAASALADSLTASDDGEAEALEKWMSSLSDENLTLAKVITKVITVKFDCKFDEMKKEIDAKNETIVKISNEIDRLTNRVADLESNLEELQQYSRRDCMVFNGPSLPKETENEDTTMAIIEAIKQKHKINLKTQDISASHRLGPKPKPSSIPNAPVPRTRPIIVKFVSRSTKADITSAAIALKPDLYANESLTPQRLDLLRRVRAIRAKRRDDFLACHTSEGKIVVKIKLGNSFRRFVITSESSFNVFLEHNPNLKDIQEQIMSEVSRAAERQDR